jgi:hypothetical protein
MLGRAVLSSHMLEYDAERSTRRYRPGRCPRTESCYGAGVRIGGIGRLSHKKSLVLRQCVQQNCHVPGAGPLRRMPMGAAQRDLPRQSMEDYALSGVEGWTRRLFDILYMERWQ